MYVCKIRTPIYRDEFTEGKRSGGVILFILHILKQQNIADIIKYTLNTTVKFQYFEVQ